MFTEQAFYFRLRKMKSWSQKGRVCSTYPGGLKLNLRRNVWLRVPYPQHAQGIHPRQRFIDLVQQAHKAGAISWLLATDPSDGASDESAAAAAGK